MATLFLPPTSPTSSTAHNTTTPSFAYATATPTAVDYFSYPSTTTSRKRQRTSQDQHRQQPPSTTPSSWVQCPTPSDSTSLLSNSPQNSLLINDRYTLQDGYDTPSLLASTTAASMAHIKFPTSDDDNNCRRRLRDPYPEHMQSETLHAPLFGALARERNGVARMPSSSASSSPLVLSLPSSENGEPRQGWTGFAFALVGTVVKMGSSVFRGFYAGGGKGYPLVPMVGGGSMAAERSWILQQQRHGMGRGEEACSAPLPGAWHDEYDIDDGVEFLGDFEQDKPTGCSPHPVSLSPAAASRRPHNKRRHTDRDAWVVVGPPDLADTTSVDDGDSPRRRKNSRSSSYLSPTKTTATSGMRRSLAPAQPPSRRRQSHYNSHSGGSPHFARASLGRASPSFTAVGGKDGDRDPHPSRGRPSLPHSSPRRHTAYLAQTPSRTGNSGGFYPNHDINNNDGTVDKVYMSPEAARLIRQHARQERKTDEAVSDMTRRLAGLIRQGQAALGTKIEVEGGEDGNGDDGGACWGEEMDVDLEADEDEGFVDDDAQDVYREE